MGASMKRLLVATAIGSGLALAGCQTTDQTLDVQQASATSTVLKRAQFESTCPDASATVLSRNLVRPPQDDRRMGYAPDVAQYTVGVSGCGQRSVYTVLCQVGSTSCTVVESKQSAPDLSRSGPPTPPQDLPPLPRPPR
jgi:hypothetical protein